MFVLQVDTVNIALHSGLALLLRQGERAESRNGPVITVPGPVTTMTKRPDCRVISADWRGENPFFHFVESLWMLAGRNDLAPLKTIVARMGNYSDDGGVTQPGAYGFRWRRHFAFDQLDWAVNRLQRDPNDRRVVVSMWDPKRDPAAADRSSADVPCNTVIYLLVRSGKLDMTVCCRSNDAVWGAHGANAVHFSVLQEYLAARIGVGLGYLWQVSNNYHAYEAVLTDEMVSAVQRPPVCAYFAGEVAPYPLMEGGLLAQEWEEDLAMWWQDPYKVGLRHRFFRRVATPILAAQKTLASRDPARFVGARQALEQCHATDWKAACLRFVDRAEARYSRAADGGPQAAT